MSIRPTQQATYAQVQRSLTANFSLLVRSQEQISSGKRIVRASDDPIGTSQALAFRRQIALAEPGDVGTVEQHFAARGLEQADERSGQGGFAAAAFADEAEDFAGVDDEIDTVDGAQHNAVAAKKAALLQKLA